MEGLLVFIQRGSFPAWTRVAVSGLRSVKQPAHYFKYVFLNWVCETQSATQTYETRKVRRSEADLAHGLSSDVTVTLADFI